MNLQNGGIPSRGGIRFKGNCKTGSPDNPLVTVIVVVLNGEKDLERCIISVIQQRYANIELIVIDGGSTDQSIDIIKKYEDRIDYWQSEPDHGIYDAMNKGIDLSHGNWIYFLGADDVMLPDLDKIVSYFKDSYTIYYGNVLLNKYNKLYDGKFNSFKLARRNICQQAIFYPISVLKKYKYNINYPVLSDWEYNMRCNKDTNIKFEFIPHTISIYNYSVGISFTRYDVKFYEDYLKLIRINFKYWIYLLIYIKQNMILVLKKFGIEKYLKKFFAN